MAKFIYTENDLIPLSALQHLIFIERQCALIHVEQVWIENLYTAEGRIMDEYILNNIKDKQEEITKND